MSGQHGTRLLDNLDWSPRANRGQPRPEVPTPRESRLTPQSGQRQHRRHQTSSFAVLWRDGSEGITEPPQQLACCGRRGKPSERRTEADQQLRSFVQATSHLERGWAEHVLTVAERLAVKPKSATVSSPWQTSRVRPRRARTAWRGGWCDTTSHALRSSELRPHCGRNTGPQSGRQPAAPRARHPATVAGSQSVSGRWYMSSMLLPGSVSQTVKAVKGIVGRGIGSSQWLVGQPGAVVWFTFAIADPFDDVGEV